MGPVRATWRPIGSSEALKRSSQILSVVGTSAYIFGGELHPRQPRDNHVHVVELGRGGGRNIPNNSNNNNNHEPLITSVAATPESPSPRVGSASTTLGGKIYLFSGRGGVAMAPIEENGALWVYDPSSSSSSSSSDGSQHPGPRHPWSLVSPKDPSSPYPAARSYHCLASSGGGDGGDDDNDAKIYVHAGCPETGRLSDLWSFRVADRVWVQLASAPDPPRGGTSIAVAGGLLYRMNGFDGRVEQGGSLDVYDPKTDAWSSRHFPPDGVSGPSPRSVSALLPVRRGGAKAGKPSLVTLFGERDPSSLGHQGAGKMAADVWIYDVDDQRWDEVEIIIQEGDRKKPAARGWFAADVLSLKEDSSSSSSSAAGAEATERIVVQGGLGETNERLDDIWMLEFLNS